MIVASSVTDLIGKTPVVRINNLTGHSITVPSIVESSVGTRLRFDHWSDGSSSPSNKGARYRDGYEPYCCIPDAVPLSIEFTS
jgi:hypothetical protein